MKIPPLFLFTLAASSLKSPTAERDPTKYGENLLNIIYLTFRKLLAFNAS